MSETDIKQITLLSDHSMQANLFKQSIEANLNVSLNIVPFSQLANSFNPTLLLNEIILVDYAYLDQEKFEQYTQVRSACKHNVKEIVINCPKDLGSSHLFKWRGLVAVFYVNDALELLLKGMKKVMQDEMWLSRKLAQDYIQHFRCSNSVTTSKTYTSLTKREKEIIHLLGHGASNIQIAEELFVSENTVKTHLHNIFKKINAKNRLQALLWANNNIGMEERV